jgi:hypothetical protein
MLNVYAFIEKLFPKQAGDHACENTDIVSTPCKTEFGDLTVLGISITHSLACARNRGRALTANREHPLPHRASETFDFESMGPRFTASIGCYPDGRPVCELRVKLPPCGRGLGPCKAVIETNSAGTCLRCLTCDCVAPYPLKANKNAV